MLEDFHYTVVVCFEDARRKRFLLARHRKRGWELPGGRLQSGEETAAAAVREFCEETGHELLETRFLLRQQKSNGVAHVFTGLWGRPLPQWTRPPQEAIEEVRFVERLGDVAPLSFPDDPYEEMEAALGRALR